MNSGEIKQLLEKYYRGETSSEEEHQLREFFKSPDVPEEFIIDRDLFRYYSVSSEINEPPADFEERIISSLDRDLKEKEKTGLKSFMIWVSGIAAAVVILAGSYHFLIRNRQPADTYSDPQIAYAETMKILYEVSNRLNNGTKELERINTMKQVTIGSLNTINKSSGALQEVIKPLEDFSRKIEK